MRFINLIIGSILFVIIVSCSSLSGSQKNIVVNRNKAVEYAGYGNDYFNKGMYNQAVEFFLLSLAYNGSIYYETGIIDSYNSLGKTYMASNDPDKALIYFEKGYTLAKQINSSISKTHCANNIGEYYLSLKDFDKALSYFNEALHSIDNKTPVTDKAIVLHNIGITYKRMGNIAEALTHIQEALAINKNKKLAGEMASNYFLLAAIYSEQSDFVNALLNAQSALENDRKTENSLAIASDYFALGTISIKSGKDKDAYDFFKKSLFVYQSLEKIYPDLSLSQNKLVVIQNLLETAVKLGLNEDSESYKKMLEEK